MGELVKRIDGRSPSFILTCVCGENFRLMPLVAPLAAHFEDQGVEYMQFAFRWMNCLLMREISVKCTVRMWDTYLVSEAFITSQRELADERVADRRKGRTRSRSSICMCARHCW